MGRKEDLRQVDHWTRYFGVGRDELSIYVHTIKCPGLRKNPNLVVDKDNGNIFIKGTNECVGYVYDCRRMRIKH